MIIQNMTMLMNTVDIFYLFLYIYIMFSHSGVLQMQQIKVPSVENPKLTKCSPLKASCYRVLDTAANAGCL